MNETSISLVGLGVFAGAALAMAWHRVFVDRNWVRSFRTGLSLTFYTDLRALVETLAFASDDRVVVIGAANLSAHRPGLDAELLADLILAAVNLRRARGNLPGTDVVRQLQFSISAERTVRPSATETSGRLLELAMSLRHEDDSAFLTVATDAAPGDIELAQQAAEFAAFAMFDRAVQQSVKG